MRYLLITYLHKADGKIDEQVAVAKKVKPKDIQTCNVIMDFKELKIEKCMVDGHSVDTDWGKLSTYYRQVYPAIIERLEEEARQE